MADYWDCERENEEGPQDEDEDFGGQREQPGRRRAVGDSDRAEQSRKEIGRLA